MRIKTRKQVIIYFQALLIYSLIIGCKGKKHDLPDPYEAGWKGEPVCEVIEDNSEIRLLKCVFPPNVGHEMHYHNPHTGYTIAGSRFRITDSSGTREVNVPTGYSFSKNEMSEHIVLNIGDSTAIFLIIEYK